MKRSHQESPIIRTHKRKSNMKKTYIAPKTLSVKVETLNPIAASGVTVNFAPTTEGDYNGEFYSKKHYDVWADDEE
mgnify:CR=1 FL=1